MGGEVEESPSRVPVVYSVPSRPRSGTSDTNVQQLSGMYTHTQAGLLLSVNIETLVMPTVISYWCFLDRHHQVA